MGIVATACTTSSSSTGPPHPRLERKLLALADAALAGTARERGRQETFTIDAQDFFFSPNVLMGSAGQQLTLTIDNQGAATHTFTIASEHIDVTLAPGTQQTVKVTFPNSGSTEFLCRFHESMGMTGELQVA